MNPFLVFLNAARNLAGMGMKKEQVLDFAQREFGELTDLMKSQIDSIYKPKKPVDPKNPDFDNTVVKMKFDDEGRPFNPRDPLKNLSKKDKKAEGGRIGFKEGNGNDDGIPGIALSIEERMERIKKLLKQMQDIQKDKDVDRDPEEKAEGGRIGLRIGSGEGKDVSGREYSAPSAAAKSVSTSPSRDDGPPGGDNFVDTTTKNKIIGGGGEVESPVFGGRTSFDQTGITSLSPAILSKIVGMSKKIKPVLGGDVGLEYADQLGDELTNFKIIQDIENLIKEKKLNPELKYKKEIGDNTLIEGGLDAGGDFNILFKKKFAGGGRVGLKEGVTQDGLLFPMKKDGFLISPDFDNMTEEQKMIAETMKIQEKKRQERLRKLLEKFKESLPENERNIKPVPMPTVGPEFRKGLESLAGGGRVGFKKGLLARMMEGLTPDGGIFQSIFANRKHPILSTLNSMELLSVGESLMPFLGFNEGGRVGLKDGMDRRKFLKIMGGLASLPIVGKFLKFAKPAAPAAQKVMENFSTKVSEAPTYFFDLVTKIKAFGKKSKVGPSDKVDEYSYTGKNGDEYTLTEDIVTGDAQIVKDKMGVGNYGDKSFDTINDRSVMEYKAPKKDVDPDTQKFIDEGAEYEEYKIEFDMDGTEAGADAIEETIQKEIIEEAKKSAPPIKKAAGGLAYMLGE
jgi:hypothetical protein